MEPISNKPDLNSDIEKFDIAPNLTVEFEKTAPVPPGSAKTTGGMIFYRVFENKELISIGGSTKYAYPVYKELILKRIKKSRH